MKTKYVPIFSTSFYCSIRSTFSFFCVCVVLSFAKTSTICGLFALFSFLIIRRQDSMVNDAYLSVVCVCVCVYVCVRVSV